MRVWVGLLFATVFSAGGFPPTLHAQEAEAKERIWVVAEYDPARDPAADLQEATTRAQAEGKRILLEVGGEWCGWCHRLDLFIKEHPAILQRLSSGFLFVKVNYGRENRNQEFLSQFPTIPGYPHIFVMEMDGSFLHSQDTLPLEEGSTYNEKAILDFLDTWAPKG